MLLSYCSGTQPNYFQNTIIYDRSRRNGLDLDRRIFNDLNIYDRSRRNGLELDR